MPIASELLIDSGLIFLLGLLAVSFVVVALFVQTAENIVADVEQKPMGGMIVDGLSG